MAQKVNVLIKYLDFVNVFLKKLVIKLFKHFIINKYLINLELSQQPLYRFIYNLKQPVFKNLKIYIKINLANNFIHLFKFSIGAAILFI